MEETSLKLDLQTLSNQNIRPFHYPNGSLRTASLPESVSQKSGTYFSLHSSKLKTCLGSGGETLGFSERRNMTREAPSEGHTWGSEVSYLWVLCFSDCKERTLSGVFFTFSCPCRALRGSPAWPHDSSHNLIFSVLRWGEAGGVGGAAGQTLLRAAGRASGQVHGYSG